MIRKLFTVIVALFLPSRLACFVLCIMGHKVSLGARIGFSILMVDQLCMDLGSSIGHFNFLHCRRIVLRTGAYIRHCNVVKGPVSVWLEKRGAIGNRNIIKRGPKPVTYGPAQLHLGQLTKITSSHVVDCTRSVTIGDFSILAGLGSQLWTHGYYHFPEGPDRLRIDGSIDIGRNVYVGSACVIAAGVRIADRIAIGAHSSVSRNLDKSGMYVSQPLRYIEMDLNQKIDHWQPVLQECCDRVYVKASRNGNA
jgi:acetyltransferase-like isoleucine patch superfamily enzyme